MIIHFTETLHIIHIYKCLWFVRIQNEIEMYKFLSTDNVNDNISIEFNFMSI